SLDTLTDIMKTLRRPNGCPWDREQTPETIIPFIIEEAYEVIDAIETGTPKEQVEELGDLLFQVIFVSELASEKNLFNISDVIESSIQKMTRRHPHVFEKNTTLTSKEVIANWGHIKEREKTESNSKDNDQEDKSILSGIPATFPALHRAHKVSQKVAKVGFDWQCIDKVFGKVYEELSELKEAIKNKDAENTEEEIGDVLFTLVNLARFAQVNPENALRKSTNKFINRFSYIEKSLKKDKKELGNTPLEELERLWGEAKKREKPANTNP
ncbi:MAG: nucleoside triphosphate pyrophosphohydrolase, partial [Deltaproteobacteria bacterium]|nr:nucleoside triphosphate pyrophosphohydrolase [Deltaproteobacteria bacterium]